jgi:ABC-type phosphate transport system substrate-binding protein
MNHKKSLIKSIKLALFMIATTCLCAFCLTACGDDDKQVPVYQGMSISSTSSGSSASANIAQAASAKLSTASSQQNAATDLPYSGDSSDRNDNINQTRPYGNGETIHF